MKVKENFELMNVAGDYIVVPLGENMATFKGTVVLNEISARIYELLRTTCTMDELVLSIISEYDLDKKTAESDIAETIAEMLRIGIIEE